MDDRRAPHRAAELTDARDGGVEIGNAYAEALEAGLVQPGRGRAHGSGFVPLQQIDRAALVAARPEQDRRVPASPVETERSPGLCRLGCGVRAGGETKPFGIETAGTFEIGTVHVDMEEPSVGQGHGPTPYRCGGRRGHGWRTERISLTGYVRVEVIVASPRSTTANVPGRSGPLMFATPCQIALTAIV